MAVRHTLGLDGYALVLRLLCTLACCESSECPDYADKAVAQIKSLLLQRDHRSSESSIKSFLSAGIIELLVNGTFRLQDGLVRAVTPLVTALLDGNGEAGRDFQQRIAQGWGVTDVRDGAIHRIRANSLSTERFRARNCGGRCCCCRPNCQDLFYRGYPGRAA